MTWVKVDDQFPDHPKWDQLAADEPERWARAMAVWLAACCYCSRHLTDGAMSAARLRRLTPLGDRALAAADDLVDCGLWERTDDGFQVHDFLEYNPSRASVQSQRDASAQRQRDRRARQLGVTHLSQRDSTVTSQRDSASQHQAVTGPRPDPTRPDPTPVGEPGTAPDGAGARGRVRKRRPETALPDSLAPSKADREYCERHNLDMTLEWQKFVSHAQSNDRRCRDWSAAWRNWLARSVEYQRDRTAGKAALTEHRQAKAEPIPVIPGLVAPQELAGEDTDRAGEARLAKARLEALRGLEQFGRSVPG